jgi:hypothetical protein
MYNTSFTDFTVHGTYVRYLGTILRAVRCCAVLRLRCRATLLDTIKGTLPLETWNDGIMERVFRHRHQRSVRVSRGPLRSHSGYDLPLGS